jgi:hypothetical protein
MQKVAEGFALQRLERGIDGRLLSAPACVVDDGLCSRVVNRHGVKVKVRARAFALPAETSARLHSCYSFDSNYAHCSSRSVRQRTDTRQVSRAIFAIGRPRVIARGAERMCGAQQRRIRSAP